MDSILSSVKKAIGISPDDTNFDDDIILHINSVFGVLAQLGVGPADGYMIVDASSNWEDYLDGDKLLEMVKTYMILKVRMYFDPPSSSAHLDSVKNLASELEWRITVMAGSRQ